MASVPARRARGSEVAPRERLQAERATAPEDRYALRLLELQRSAGNAAVARLMAATPSPSRLARQVDVPEDERAEALDQGSAAGSSATLSLAGIGSGLAIESFSLTPRTGGGSGKPKLTEITVTRRLDEHSTAIQQHAATGKSIATAEIAAKGESGGFVFRMSGVLVSSHTIAPHDAIESFTLDFADSSFEKT